MMTQSFEILLALFAPTRKKAGALLFSAFFVSFVSTLAFSPVAEARRQKRNSSKNSNVVSIDTRVNTKRVSVGDTFQLDVVVTVRSNASLEELVLPDLSAFRVLDDKRHRSQSVYSKNGVRTEEYTRTYTYILLAERVGKHSISTARARVGAQVAKSKSLSVVVERAPRKRRPNQTNQQDYFLKVAFDKEKAFIGEQVNLSVEVYASSSVDIRPLKVPSLPGFWVEELGSKQVRATERRIGGRSFYVYLIKKLAVFPLDVGIHDTGSISVQVTTGGGLWSRGKKRVLNAPAQRLEVMPLPSPKEAGASVDLEKGFEGNVGFYRLRSSLSASSTHAGQAVSLKITLSGEGNPGQARLPDVEKVLKKIEGLRVFPPSLSESKSVERGHLYGEKSIELLVQPLNPGRIQLPSFSTTFFNPISGKYERSSSRPLLLKVSAKKAVSSTKKMQQKRQKEISGTRPLATRLPLLGSPQPLWRSVLWTTLPLIFFSFALNFFFRRRKRRGNSASGRLARAEKECAQKVAEAERSQKLQDVQELLFQVLMDYVDDDARGFPLPELQRRLFEKGLSQELSQHITLWLEQVDAVRYAGETGERRALFSTGKHLLTQLFVYAAKGICHD
ncbi:MAG: protein BatD [Deltaproteobacteria bacterium]|nr:protein BatD [Deltaproteobacteria bacterium]